MNSRAAHRHSWFCGHYPQRPNLHLGATLLCFSSQAKAKVDVVYATTLPLIYHHLLLTRHRKYFCVVIYCTKWLTLTHPGPCNLRHPRQYCSPLCANCDDTWCNGRTNKLIGKEFKAKARGINFFLSSGLNKRARQGEMREQQTDKNVVTEPLSTLVCTSVQTQWTRRTQYEYKTSALN